MRAVILSGNCGPLSSSPATAGTANPVLSAVISCPLSGREKLYLLMRVTNNVCISMTLLVEKEWLISSHPFPFDRKASLGTHANRHPAQLLGPPEKVALYRRTSIHRKGNGCGSMLRTGCRKPQKAFQAFRSCRAIVPVGSHRRPVPTSLCSCKTVRPVSTPGFLQECGARERAYKLYPSAETNTSVPAGTGNSL